MMQHIQGREAVNINHIGIVNTNKVLCDYGLYNKNLKNCTIYNYCTIISTKTLTIINVYIIIRCSKCCTESLSVK